MHVCVSYTDVYAHVFVSNVVLYCGVLFCDCVMFVCVLVFVFRVF